MDKPAGRVGLITKTLVPLMPVTVYAVVAEIGVPTTPLTD